MFAKRKQTTQNFKLWKLAGGNICVGEELKNSLGRTQIKNSLNATHLNIDSRNGNKAADGKVKDSNNSE